jgi:hypothetical protein
VIEQFGDAKIQKLGVPSADQNISGLDVAMNDQVLVRVMNGRADTAKEFQARID